jgi:hypothetical protein
MKLTKDDIANVIEMYKSGLSTNKIGDKVGVDAESIRYHLKRNGIEVRSTRKVSAESDVIDEYLSGKTLNQIAKKRSVSDSVIARILLRNNIKQREYKKPKFGKAQYPDLLKDYYDGMSSGAIAKKHGLKPSVITDTLHRAGCVFRDNSEHHQIYKLDHSVFENKSEDLMYWLGFIASDGNIHDNCLNITTHSDDAYHLQSFLDFCKSTHTVRKNKNENTHRIDIRNRKLASILIELGITRNKSLTFSPTKEMCESTSFWRGMVDGDGSVTTSKRGDLTISLCSGSEACITAFERWVKGKTDTLAKVSLRNCYYFKVSCRHAVKIAEELYAGEYNYALKRKSEKAKKFLDVH